MKQCSKCKELKPLTDFNRRSDYKHRYKSACKLCSREDPKLKAERNKKWIENNAEHFKDKTLLRKFGISLSDYNKLLTKQDNRCAICRISKSDLRRDLSVDHDHATGKVRGLLCDPCNIGLGLFKDNKILLNNATICLNGESMSKSTSTKSYQAEIDKVHSLGEELRKAQKDGMDSIVSVLKDMIRGNDMLVAISWTQYTPYFMDGDACEFGVNELEFKLQGDESFVYSYEIEDHLESKKDILDFNKSAYKSTAELLDSLNEIHADLRSMDGALRDQFGDHVRVVLTKDSIETEEYEHD